MMLMDRKLTEDEIRSLYCGGFSLTEFNQYSIARWGDEIKAYLTDEELLIYDFWTIKGIISHHFTVIVVDGDTRTLYIDGVKRLSL